MATGTFYVTEKIGPKRSLTPEGFLLCEEVPLARTGMMIYGPDETPIEAGPDGIVKVFREPEDVFRPETIASANGKSVTIEHPEEDVNPENWRDLTGGIMMNVRRGEGAMDDLMIGDLLITTPEAIEAVQNNLREVSLGYEADYEQTGEGTGKQSGIIINHIALVEQGRCGPRCAISDHKPNVMKGKTMAKKSKILDALMRAFKAKDAEEVEKLAKEVADEGEMVTGDEGEGGDTHVHVHLNGGEATEGGEPDMGSGRAQFTDEDIQQHIDKNEAEHAEMFSRIEELEKLVAKLADGTEDDEGEVVGEMADEFPEEMKEEATKAKDSAYLADSFRDTVAMAEILVPGIRVPTFDRAAKKGSTFKQICGLRRQALDLAYHQPDTRAVLDDLLAGKRLDTKSMTCDAARTLFRAAAAAKRASNNGQRTVDGRAPAMPIAGGPALTLADINRINAERYGKK